MTAIKKAEERIRHMALHDSLTGLPNRQLFRDRFLHDMNHAKRYGDMVGLLYIDLDRFKRINDLHGHDAGDKALCETAARLLSCVREPDTVARIGGDEFVVTLSELSAPENAGFVAGRIISALAKPMVIDGDEHGVGASIGVSVYPTDSDNLDELLRMADKAMYEVKRRSGSGVLYHSGLTGPPPDGGPADA